MLAIRMQRTGRKGHASFRIVVQDSHKSPTSGKVVAQIGSYDPHTKTNTLAKDKAQFYLDHGAQPSERVALLLKSEGVKLPKWVEVDNKKAGKLRNPEKLRKNQPAKAEEPKEEVMPEESPAPEVSADETPAEEPSAQDDTPNEESAEAIAAEEPTTDADQKA